MGWPKKLHCFGNHTAATGFGLRGMSQALWTLMARRRVVVCRVESYAMSLTRGPGEIKSISCNRQQDNACASSNLVTHLSCHWYARRQQSRYVVVSQERSAGLITTDDYEEPVAVGLCICHARSSYATATRHYSDARARF